MVRDGGNFGYGFAITLNEFDHNCQEATINLGKQVQNITAIDQGYKVKYSDGAQCGEGYYSSEINFICDKSAEDGWPELKSD